MSKGNIAVYVYQVAYPHSDGLGWVGEVVELNVELKEEELKEEELKVDDQRVELKVDGQSVEPENKYMFI